MIRGGRGLLFMNEHEPLLIGIIGKAHGLKGEVCLNTYNQRSSVVHTGASVLLQSHDGEMHEVEVKKSRVANKNGRHVVQLSGIESRSDAEAIRGQKIFVQRDQLDESDEQSFYYAEVIGYSVVDESNKIIGTVDYAFEGATDILVVEHDQQEWMIPVTKDVVLKIDHAKRLFTVRIPEGLEPGKREAGGPK